MATNCNDLISGINPACDALNKVGGVNKRVWIGLKGNITYTTDSNGYINTVSMATSGSLPTKLYTFTGKRDKNSFAFPLTAGENINTFNHTAMMALYYSTPSELESLNQLANADDMVVFMEGNDEKIYVLGIEKGLNATAGEGGSGILLNDSTAYMLRVNAAASLATNQAYLDALT
jgi:general stress protein 26